MSGLIRPARQVPSCNCDARPDAAPPQLIVLHGISLPPGTFGGPEIEALFTNCLDWDAHPYFDEIRGLEVSAHLLIRRDGELKLRDLSQYGTFVNEKRVSGDLAIQPADVIRIGSPGEELQAIVMEEADGT